MISISNNSNLFLLVVYINTGLSQETIHISATTHFGEHVKYVRDGNFFVTSLHEARCGISSTYTPGIAHLIAAISALMCGPATHNHLDT